MEWIAFLLGFLAICFVVFLVGRLWIGLVDGVIAGVKKLFKSEKKEGPKNRTTLDEIRKKREEK